VLISGKVFQLLRFLFSSVFQRFSPRLVVKIGFPMSAIQKLTAEDNEL
jgi:hypothetical protein